jgi:hypothetical protein
MAQYLHHGVVFIYRGLVLLRPAKLSHTLAAIAPPHDITPLARDSEWYVCSMLTNATGEHNNKCKHKAVEVLLHVIISVHFSS